MYGPKLHLTSTVSGDQNFKLAKLLRLNLLLYKNAEFISLVQLYSGWTTTNLTDFLIFRLTTGRGEGHQTRDVPSQRIAGKGRTGPEEQQQRHRQCHHGKLVLQLYSCYGHWKLFLDYLFHQWRYTRRSYMRYYHENIITPIMCSLSSLLWWLFSMTFVLLNLLKPVFLPLKRAFFLSFTNLSVGQITPALFIYICLFLCRNWQCRRTQKSGLKWDADIIFSIICTLYSQAK